LSKILFDSITPMHINDFRKERKLKKIVSLIILCLATGLFAQSRLEINIFNHPQFEYEEINFVDFMFKNIKADSVSQINILSGKILSKPQNDSLTVSFLNRINPDIACPTDYYFQNTDDNFNLLSSNVSSDSIFFMDSIVVPADSFKVGFLAINSPDNFVKHGKPDHINFDYDMFDITRQKAKQLAQKCDVVVLLSNMGKYVDRSMIAETEVDFVLSFDYQKKRNETFKSGQKFYSIITQKGKYGKLVLDYRHGKLNTDWQQIEIKKN